VKTSKSVEAGLQNQPGQFFQFSSIKLVFGGDVYYNDINLYKNFMVFGGRLIDF
jgi:hypothetical protein